MKKLISALAIASLSFGAAAASAPTASLTTSGTTFAEYTGSIVGSNDLGAGTSTLYWMAESSLGNLTSYLVMFDPSSNARIAGTVTFAGGNIVALADTRTELLGSQIFAKSGVTYDWKANSGLENNDTLTVSGGSLTLDWRGNGPGDYVRVVVQAVPEPESYAMFLAGLGIIGVVAKRRKKA